jgi:hypothetical protein
MLSKKEMGMIALAGVGVIGIGYFAGDALGGGGAARAGKILGSPGALPGGLPSAGTGSSKQIAAITGYMAPGTKTAVTPEMRKEFSFVPSKTAFAGKQTRAFIGGTGPIAYKAPTQFVKPTASTRYEFIASPTTPGMFPKTGGLTAKGLATKKKVEARKASGFVGYSGSRGTASAQKAAYMARKG